MTARRQVMMVACGAWLTTLLAISPAQGAGNPCLEDAEPLLNTQPFPKIMKSMLGVRDAKDAKFDAVTYRPNQAPVAHQIKQANPGTRLHLQYSGRAYQGDAATLPFTSTGPQTDLKGMMFAGHWLYKAGTRLSQDLAEATTGAQTTVFVDSTSMFSANQYVVIYDSEALPAQKFAHAEHALIVSVNAGAGSLTITRGYKSTASAHAKGSVIAQHALGMVPSTANTIWSYNHSTRCPLDASGETASQKVADWISANYNLDGSGKPLVSFVCDGVQFDADTASPGGDADIDNDLTNDKGVLGSVNEWLAGYQKFYSAVRGQPAFANKSIVGGVADSMGFGADELSGTQMEHWPECFLGEDYEARLAHYAVHTHHHPAAAPYTECLYKFGTPLYASAQGEGEMKTWKDFRYAFALALMGDGFFGQKAEGADPWYEEFSVAPKTGIADPLSNPNNRNWMGRAISGFKRLHDAAAFDSSKAILQSLGATGALNGDYTLCFTASASATTKISFGLGTASRKVFVPTTPKKYVFTFYGMTGTRDIKIGGAGLTVKDIYLFKGTADLLRRDFEHAVVFLNMAKQPTTITFAAGERFMRIKGQGGAKLDPMNDGKVFEGDRGDSLSLAGEDGVILVRLSAPPPLPDGGVADSRVDGVADAGAPSPDQDMPDGALGDRPGEPGGCGCHVTGRQARLPMALFLLLTLLHLCRGRWRKRA